MQHISIIGKFLTIMAAFGLFILGVVTYSATQIWKIDTDYSELLTSEARAAQNLIRANRAFQAARASIAEMTIVRTEADSKRAMEDSKAAQAAVVQSFDLAMAALPLETSFGQLKSEALRALSEGCKPTTDLASVASADADVKASQDMFISSCQPLFGPVASKIVAASEAVAKSAEDQSDELTEVSKSTITTTFAIVLSGLAIVLLAGFLAIRAWMVNPIKSLADTMGRLANSDFSVAVGGTERKDEIGGMSKAVQVFKDNGVRAEKLAAETESMRSDAESTRLLAAAADHARAEAMAQATTGLGEGLKHLASGDLTFRLANPFAADFETLRADFNTAVGQLSETLRAVADATSGIDTGSKEVSASADDLSKRTEQQAASLEETAAALDQITVNVANSSKRADEARKVAVLANESAAQSGKVVANAVDAMQKIEQSSNEISVCDVHAP